MSDLEEELRLALRVAPARIDTSRLAASVKQRLNQRRRRKLALACGALTVALVGLASYQRARVTPSAPAVQARKTRAPRRAMFAFALARSSAGDTKALGQEIEQLHAKLADAPDSEMGELWYRLGDAHDRRRRALASPSDAQEALFCWRLLYDDPRYHAHPRRAEALFGAAYLLFEEDRPDDAQFLFRRLAEDSPDSPLAANAEVALAEPLFDAGEWEAALLHYRAVLNHPQSPLYTFARYKIGWVLYNQGQTAEAIQQLKAVLDESARGLAVPKEVLEACRQDVAHLEGSQRP
jgi:tetratricopeptide (TPR) repeat protein